MATIPAAAATQAAIQTAITSAASGDTVTIPDGTVSVSSAFTLGGKNLIIAAQNKSAVSQGRSNQSVILTNNSSSPMFTFATGNSHHCGFDGIRFNEGSGAGNHFRFTGSGTKVPLVRDCYIQVKPRYGNNPDTAAVAHIAKGGVYWQCYFSGEGFTDSGDPGTGSAGPSVVIYGAVAWDDPSTMGTLDTGGLTNVYIEDCRWKNLGQAPDVEDNGRAVLRYCLFDGAGGLTHGLTSAAGGRHFEFYNNTFQVTTNGRDLDRYFWVRAGTGIITDCVVNDHSFPGGWGGTLMLELGEGDDRPPGSFGSYPIPHQPGRGANNTLEPIYCWNNTGSASTDVNVTSTWTSYIQQNREFYINNGAKPGYSKYTYPHPARAALDGGGGGIALSAPTWLRAMMG